MIIKYILGKKSLSKLKGVHPDIVSVVELALQLSDQDFSVHSGIRTKAQQKHLVTIGASQTMNSKHRKQKDGFGHAVDLVPYVQGRLRWEWPLIYPIASAMATASRELRVSIRWGGVWDKFMLDMSRDPCSLKEEVGKYCVRHQGPDFLDGPHYELVQ